MSMALGCRVVSLQKPTHDHPEIMERPHANFGPDLLETVASFGEQKTGILQIYTK